MSLQKDLAALMVSMSIGSSNIPLEFHKQLCEFIQNHNVYMLNAVCDKNKMTLLQYAILQNKKEYVQILIDMGADPNLSHGIKIKPLFINAFRDSEITEILIGTGKITKADVLEDSVRRSMKEILYPISQNNKPIKCNWYKSIMIFSACCSTAIALYVCIAHGTDTLYNNKVVDAIKRICAKCVEFSKGIVI